MYKKLLIFVILSLLLILTACGNAESNDDEGIKVGILFSLSGGMAVAESSQANAALMAIDEINENGGINGEMLIPVQEDYNSDPSEAATKMRKLILEDEVVATIGTHTSDSRQAVLPIVEDNNSVLMYSSAYEGEEYSKNIIYTGNVPNQSLEPLIPWITENLGSKIYYVGSDYVFPVQLNNQATALLELEGGEVVGEEYAPMGHTEFSSILDNIRRENPDVILNSLAGDSNASFFNQFAEYGLDSDDISIVSVTLIESQLAEIGEGAGEGHYAAQAYFQTIDTPENKEFTDAYKERYGENEPITTWSEVAYYNVYLLAQALEEVEDPYDSDSLLEEFVGLEFDAPQGKIKVDENNHLWVHSRIAQINSEREFEIIHESEETIKPEPWSELLFPNHEKPWESN